MKQLVKKFQLINKHLTVEKVLVALFTFSTLLAVVFYQYMPLQMASRWNVYGYPSALLPREIVLLFAPGTFILLLVLFAILKQFSVYKTIPNSTKLYLHRTIILVALFLFYISCLSLIWNIQQFSIAKYIIPGVSILLFYIAYIMKSLEPNSVIGIRNPWTLRNEQVWYKTHDMAGFLFNLVAIMSLFAVFKPEYSLFLVFIPLCIAIIYVYLYSYQEYKEITKQDS